MKVFELATQKQAFLLGKQGLRCQGNSLRPAYMQAVRLCHGFPGPVLLAGRSGTPEGSRDRIWGNIRAKFGIMWG